MLTMVQALEIRTNTAAAEAYFMNLLPSFGFIVGVDAFVEPYP